jgi:hypothetical protein
MPPRADAAPLCAGQPSNDPITDMLRDALRGAKDPKVRTWLTALLERGESASSDPRRMDGSSD